MTVLRVICVVALGSTAFGQGEPILPVLPTVTGSTSAGAPGNCERFNEWLDPRAYMNCPGAALKSDACRFRWRDAVKEVNEPQLIPAAQTSSESAESLSAPADGTCSPGTCQHSRVCKHQYVVFPGAARFPMIGYDKWGCPVEENAAVIYEGMAIRVEENGEFTVRFVMEAPATSVTVRLQFVVWNKSQGQVGTVTLPPLHFDPDRDLQKAGENRLWKVQQQGYSPLLQCTRTECGIRLERTGSARIGSAPERQNLF